MAERDCWACGRRSHQVGGGTQGKMFDGLPYRKFVYFYFFRPAEASAALLEHQIRSSYSGRAGEGSTAR
jgi:hypothetical protein